MNILVGYDGSNVAKDAIALAEQQAKAFNAKVFIVASMEFAPQVERHKYEVFQEDLKEAKARFDALGIDCQTEVSVKSDNAGEDLLQHARDLKADLIIIGVKRRSKLEKLVFGSTARYVIMEAPCPVLTVK
ncbi:MAG: universal stress protein [Desulfobacteraceae bacterium]|jgi:nucleotide-binding universal stress UspA family protein|nr:universal stress protein [Desulfobacteraceae bacterium]